MAQSKSTMEWISRFDHLAPFEHCLDASQGDVFIAAFHGQREFFAVSVSKKFSQSVSEIIELIQSHIKSSPSKSIELRMAGNLANMDILSGVLRDIGLSVTRRAVRSKAFVIRFIPEVGKLEISADEDPVVAKAKTVDMASSSGPIISTVAPAAKLPKVNKVLIVDDSASVTLLLKRVIESDPEMVVVGTCRLPSEVSGMVESLKPDVITMDIQMPEMDGPTLVKRIYTKYKMPIVMISSISREEGSQVLESLENGAVDYIQKPSLRPITELAEIIVPRLKAASVARLTDDAGPRASVPKLVSEWDPNYVITIGSSTGGVEALKRLLTSFPANIPPTVISHHIPSVFSETMAMRLNSYVSFQISEAKDGDILKKNHVYIAPGGYDMKIEKRGSDLVCQVVPSDSNYHYHPSVDLLFHSVARVCGQRTIGILLTGMGRDGADGMLALKRSGAWNIAQDESSCVVYGMPKAAFELGATDLVVHIDEIAKCIDKRIKI